MTILKFFISSPFSFFRKGETRGAKFDQSFSHIHKVSVLGIVGAIIGLEGYNIHDLKKRHGLTDEEFPEFYRELSSLKVSIVPVSETGHFPKHYETFTDTTGFYGDKGNTLIVTEQQVYDAGWEIYLDLSSVSEKTASKIEDYFLNSKAVFMPYLGKNEHFANIHSVSLLNGELSDEEVQIDSLLLQDDEIEVDEDECTYLLLEHMPWSLHQETGKHVLLPTLYTDSPLETEHVYLENGRNIVFI